MDQSAHCEQRELQRLQVLRDYHVLDTPPEVFFDDMVYLAALACATPIALITLIDSRRQWFKAKIGLRKEQTPRDVAVCNYALEDPDRVMVVEDVAHDLRFVDNPLVTGAPHMQFYAGAPLVTPEGYVLGTLCVIDTVPRGIASAQCEIMRVLARRVVAALEIRRDMAELERLSTTDALTGSWNRRAFEDRLDREVRRARRYGLPLSMMLVDVDLFKRFNDLHGHPAGDRLLQSIAEDIRRNVRDADQESRFGGDEFAIILPDTGCKLAWQLAERLRSDIEMKYVGTPAISLSIGVAELDGGIHDAQTLLASADDALYEAKRAGRNRVIDAGCLDGVRTS